MNSIYLTLLLCLATLICKGQDTLKQVDIHTSLALPFNESGMQDSTLNNELMAFGFGAGIMVPLPKNLPLKVGANFRYMWMGGKTKDFDMVDDNGTTYNLESKVRGSMLPFHAMLRLDPMRYTKFPVVPYIGGFAGFRIFESKRQLIIDYQDGSEPITETKRNVSVTSSYGFEIGLHIKTSEKVLIDFRYEHAYGGRAKYLDLSSVIIDDEGNATYDRLETHTNVSIYTIGIVVNIE